MRTESISVLGDLSKNPEMVQWKRNIFDKMVLLRILRGTSKIGENHFGEPKLLK